MTPEERAGLESLRYDILSSGVPCATLGAFEDEIRADAADRADEWFTEYREVNDLKTPDGWLNKDLRAAITGKEPTK